VPIDRPAWDKPDCASEDAEDHLIRLERWLQTDVVCLREMQPRVESPGAPALICPELSGALQFATASTG